MRYSSIICLLLVTFTSFTYANEANGQSILDKKISLNVKDELLKDALHQITEKNGVNIIFTGNEIFNTQKVNISANELTLRSVLNKLLSPYPLTYKVVDANIVIKRLETRQPAIRRDTLPATITVRGKVTDAIGNALPGVSIGVKGKAQGTFSNDAGNFSITVNSNDSLRFSFLGYAPQVWGVKNRTILNVVMEAQQNSLNEVVITGLGNKQKKISVVGALSSVSAKELRQSPVANISNALAGRMPGLFTVQSNNEPGAGTNFYIRGLATIGASTRPLIVVDGLIRDAGDFGQMDPNEIESVTILKDASSTALYGIQGANGVVVVTTRRGHITSRPDISFTAQYGLQSPVRLPQFLDQYQLALYTEEANPGTYTTQELENIKNGNFDPNYYAYTNWYEYMLKDNAPQQNYNINFSGGSEFVRYFVSGSFTNQASLFDHEDKNAYGIHTDFKRYNFRSNIDIDITKDLSLRVDLAGRLENRTGPSQGYGRIFNFMSRFLPSTMNPYNPDGTYQLGSKVYVAADNENPLAALISSGYSNNFWNNMYGTFAAKHKLDFITKGLSAQFLATFQTNNQRIVSYSQDYDASRYRMDDNGKPYYEVLRTATTLQNTQNALATGNRNNYFELRFTYAHKFGLHDVSGQVIGNRRFELIGQRIPFAYQGVSSRFTYGYDNRYFAELNFGYNGSENFPKGNRYGFFPAFAAGWVLSNEKFFQDVNFVKYFKIRGSYGFVGNDNIGGRNDPSKRFLFISDYARAGGYVWGNGYYENRVGNPDVTWERAKKMDLGIDATFFNGIVGVTFDVFKQNRKNILLAPGKVPDYLGIGNLAAANTGEVMNRGFEAELKLRKTFGNSFTAFTNWQVTYARNKVLDNDQPEPLFPYQSLVGYEIGYTLGYKSLGLFQNRHEIDNSPFQSASVAPGDIKYLDVNKDGVVDAQDRVPIQIQNVPRYVFGLSAGISYKGLDISILLNGATGGTVSMSPINRDQFIKGRKIWEDRWSPDNPDARMPRPFAQSDNNMRQSDFWLQSTDYLKLRNAEIGYELPVFVSKKIGAKYMRVFVNGQNLMVWDKLWIKEGDPESTGNVTNYPAQRVINVGLNIRF